MAEQELGVVRTLIVRLVELLELFCKVDRPCHRGHEVSARDGALVLDVAVAGGLEEDGDEVVGEDAGGPEDAGDGAVVVGVVLAPELLEILETAVALVAETVPAALVPSESIDNAADGRLEDGAAVDVGLVARVVARDVDGFVLVHTVCGSSESVMNVTASSVSRNRKPRDSRARNTGCHIRAGSHCEATRSSRASVAGSQRCRLPRRAPTRVGDPSVF